MDGRSGRSVEAALTLDELVLDLDREVRRTWDEGSGSAGATATLAAVEGPSEQCLLLTLFGRRFAVPTRAVLAVSELPPIAAVPFSPPWLRGVARAAGGVVAVVDLARLLAAGPSPTAPAVPANAPDAALLPAESETTREILLVVKATGADFDAGLAVRGVGRLVSLAGVPGRPPAPGEIGACRAALVAGLVPDPAGAHLPPVAVLDVDRLLRQTREELGS
jgi:chemotaxis signal transduction protein